jgi:hypothetical protein
MSFGAAVEVRSNEVYRCSRIPGDDRVDPPPEWAAHAGLHARIGRSFNYGGIL